MPETTAATTYWHRTEDGRVQCDVCPRTCRLHEGQRGFCFVRMRQDDQIVLTTYGRSSGFCVDPIEKKPLNHFLPGSAVLSFGTAGCNLGCRFCQNWDISKSRETDTLADQATPAAIAEAAGELDCNSVAFTYNDPVIFLEYAMDVADACRERGIKAVAVTAGYMCAEPRREFYRHIDAVNVDLKAFTGDFYRRVCLAWGNWGRTCRCTSPHSIPTSRCVTGRRLRLRRSKTPGGSRWITASATPTPATRTTRPARAPTATSAAPSSSSGTGTGWAATGSATMAGALPARRACRACSTGHQGTGGEGGSRCSSARLRMRRDNGVMRDGLRSTRRSAACAESTNIRRART